MSTQPQSQSDVDVAEPYVAAGDVAAILNRIGDCVRGLPAYGRPPTAATGAAAKRTLSAISTCDPDKLADGDTLRPVLERLGAIRRSRTDQPLGGAQRIAAERWFQTYADHPVSADPGEPVLPSYAYIVHDGQVLRRCGADPDADVTADDAYRSCEDLIRDLALAGALIAAEIDRLQQRMSGSASISSRIVS